MFRDDGSQVADTDRRLIDRHEVCDRVTIENSIVASGHIQVDVRESTVEVLEDGRVAVSPIDVQPGGIRA